MYPPTPAPTIANAISREIAWYASDPPPGGSFDSAPNLSVTSTPAGPFTIIQGYLNLPNQRSNNLYLYRERVDVNRLTFGGTKELSHHFVLRIEWPLSVQTGSWEDEQQNLDTAVYDVVTRVSGPLGDKMHNGQFVGLDETQPIAVTYTDVISTILQKAPRMVVEIRYVMLDAYVD